VISIRVSGSRATAVSESTVRQEPSGTMMRASDSEAARLGASMVGLAPSGDMIALALVMEMQLESLCPIKRKMISFLPGIWLI
jgi:hypothetical protein